MIQTCWRRLKNLEKIYSSLFLLSYLLFQKNNNLKFDWIAWSETISKIIELLDKKSS